MNEKVEAPGEPGSAPHGSHDDGELDTEGARAVAAFVLRAPKRRPVLTALLFVVFGATALAAARSMSPVYLAELQLIAEPASADELRNGDPVKYGIDVARSHDTLARVVDEAHLVARTEQARPRTLKDKDRLLSWLGGGHPQADGRAAAIGSLRSRLSIEQEGTSVVIGVTWTDPQAAYDAVELEREAFLRAVYDAHVRVALDRQELADEASRKAFANLQDALRAYATSTPEPKPASTRKTVDAAPAPATRPAPAVVHSRALVEELAEKEQQARDGERRWRTALAARNDELTEALRKYTRNHPVVIQLQGEVDAVSQPPGDLVALRDELRALREQLELEVRPAPAARPSLPQPLPVETTPGDDGATLLARSTLGAAMRAHEAADEAADKEDVAVDVTRRQARDRFRLGTPAEVPDRPLTATKRLATIAALPSAALLAMLAASLLDLARGRIVESWQVRRRLKVDALAELDL
jgi:hypothetical protein